MNYKKRRNEIEVFVHIFIPPCSIIWKEQVNVAPNPSPGIFPNVQHYRDDQ